VVDKGRHPYTRAETVLYYNAPTKRLGKKSKGFMKLIRNLSAIILLCAAFVAAQDKNPTLGSLKGKARDETGKSLANVSVILRQGETEVKTASTDKNGEFVFDHLKPGVYGLTLRKAGLSTISIEDVNIRAGESVQLKDKLTMSVNEGDLALIRVSVFTAGGRIAAGVKVELMRVNGDGSMKKVGESVTGLYGQVAFRRSPDAAQYRAIAKIGNNPVSDIINVDGAAIYRTAISLPAQ
jgi:hypothetical protein